MNYYNENDHKTASWLRELIKVGLIPQGEVDERSIIDVRASDLDGFVQCHFFAGIGGWSYALKLAGWPENKSVWTGSCPCQPFSIAGRGMGESDERHLWPYFRNLIGQRKPPTVLGEQVVSPDGRKWLSGVRAQMESAGYAFGASDLCAAGVGSPHKRQRIYWVANSKRNGWRTRIASEPRQAGGATLFDDRGITCGVVLTNCPRRDAGELATASARHWYSIESASPTCRLGNANDERSQGRGLRPDKKSSQGTPWENGFDILKCTDGKSRRVEAGTFPVAHGIPNRVGLLRGYGNAIVPQVAAKFIQAYCG